MRQSIIISVFSFTLSFFIALVYWTLRIGFLDNSFFIVLKVLGISSFIIFVPIGLKLLSKKKSNYYNAFFNDTITPIYGVIILAFIGFISPLLKINISIIFIVLGYVLLCITFYIFMKEISFWQKLILVVITLFFAIWVASVCWFLYLKPHFFEGLALIGEDKIDTLYHLAISQMIKTYGVPTTGLDGIPYMKYHWGSHWIFAQLSLLLNIPVMTIYRLGFPVIFAPLLFRAFLSFVIQVKHHYKPEVKGPNLNFFFWFVFLVIFIGFIINFLSGNTWAQFSSGGTGLYLFMLLSESYTLSIILMFGILALSLNFWILKETLSLRQKSLFLFFLLPLLLGFLGFLKISTMYVLCGLLFYLFLRLKLFKNTLFIISVLLILLTFIFVFIAVFDTKEDHGGFHFFFFYDQFKISLTLFIALFYIWTHIFVILYIYKERLYKLSIREIVASHKSIPIECLLVVSIAGFIPTIVLKINSFDSLYFTEIQMWIASALVLVYIPFFYSYNRSLKLKHVLVILLCLGLFPVFYINTKTYFSYVFYENVSLRRKLLGGKGNLKEKIATAILDYNIETVPTIIKEYFKSIRKPYTQNKVLIFLQKLEELDKIPLEEKRKTLIYVDFRTLLKRDDYKWNIQCYNIAFIVPGITGMAMIEGMDVTYFDCGECCERSYGYQYYNKWISNEAFTKVHTIEELCSRVHKEGFEKLIFFNIETGLFEKRNCSN